VQASPASELPPTEHLDNNLDDIDDQQEEGAAITPAMGTESTLWKKDSPTLCRQGVELLVVDDERIILQVTKMMLANSGVKVTEAVNGAEALMLLRARAEKGEHFDCILMDCNMPIMNGLESSRQIRALEAASGR
jgi:PleD family two-component response regulator